MSRPTCAGCATWVRCVHIWDRWPAEGHSYADGAVRCCGCHLAIGGEPDFSHVGCRALFNRNGRARNLRSGRGFPVMKPPKLVDEATRARRLAKSRARAGFSISVQEERDLYAASGGLCAICHNRPAKTVDHDHKTGRIRGALCHACNRGLGLFFDSPELLRAAATYLDVSRAVLTA